MSPEENKNLVRRYIEAIDANDSSDPTTHRSQASRSTATG